MVRASSSLLCGLVLGARTRDGSITLPDVPGRYEIEVWARDVRGEAGNPANEAYRRFPLVLRAP